MPIIFVRILSPVQTHTHKPTNKQERVLRVESLTSSMSAAVSEDMNKQKIRKPTRHLTIPRGKKTNQATRIWGLQREGQRLVEAIL